MRVSVTNFWNRKAGMLVLGYYNPVWCVFFFFLFFVYLLYPVKSLLHGTSNLEKVSFQKRTPCQAQTKWRENEDENGNRSKWQATWILWDGVKHCSARFFGWWKNNTMGNSSSRGFFFLPLWLKRNNIKVTSFKCIVSWHSVCSHCLLTVTTNHLQKVFILPNWNSMPIKS